MELISPLSTWVYRTRLDLTHEILSSHYGSISLEEYCCVGV
jgi:hypothetical protein